MITNILNWAAGNKAFLSTIAALLISEFLPFVKNPAANGILQGLLSLLKKSPATAALVLALFGMTMAGCSFCQQAANKDTAQCKAETIATQCGEPAIVKLVIQVLPVVVLDLVSQNFAAIPGDVLNVLKGQGIADGTVVATCAVQVVDGNTVAVPGASMASSIVVLKAHAQECLTGGACSWVKK